MRRNILIFFSIFLCCCIHANAQQPFIKMVSVDTDSQKITISWQYTNGIDSSTLFTIYKCTNNCNSENYFTDVDKVIQSEFMWQDITADQSIPNYYSIGWTYSGKSPPQCNMVLNTASAEDGCNNAVQLIWNPYINMQDSLDHYKIFYRNTEKDTAFVLLDSVKGTHITGLYFNPANKLHYTARFLANDTFYEFLIQAVNKTNTLFPVSNIVVYKTKSVADTLVSIIIDRVSVIDDTYIQIDVSTNTFQDPFNKLLLMRAKPTKDPVTPDLLSFNAIDSAAHTPINQYRFKDENANPFSGLYYYMAIAENKCKANDTSNILTNIHLTGGRMEKYKDTILFQQRGFNEFTPPESYEVFRIVNVAKNITNDLTIKSCISDLTKRSCSYYVDVSPYLDDGTNLKYRIESGNGSYSNTYSIGHEPVIVFPNAFYPQSTHLENKTYYPIIKFPSEKDYMFLIYNRLGQEIYRSLSPPIYVEPPIHEGNWDPGNRWDGTFQGRDCPAGIYAYKISFSYNDGADKYAESGTFMLVR